MFNDLNNQLNSIATAQLQAQAQQSALQSQQDAKDAEVRHIRNKHGDVMTWHLLTKEIEDLNQQFSNDVQAINNSALPEITEQAQPHALLNDLFSQNDIHLTYIDDMHAIIPKSSSMAIADERWNEFKQKHEDFKLSWRQETKAFKEQYKSEIARLQGVEVEEHSEDASAPLDMQQQLELALKQLEEVRDSNTQLQTSNTQLQTSNTQLQTRLLDKTEEASVNHTKYLEEKHKVDLVKVKLDSFISTHDDIEDQDLLLGMMGDLQQEEA